MKFNELFYDLENFNNIKYNYHENTFNTIYFYKKILKLVPLKEAWTNLNDETKFNLSHQIVYY